MSEDNASGASAATTPATPRTPARKKTATRASTARKPAKGGAESSVALDPSREDSLQGGRRVWPD
jgi:hypothetical protein